jgi:polysaccharide pyruvyl transferase WcaK-like protein
VLADRLRPGDRVLVLNGAGVYNVGDEAILEGILHQLPHREQAIVISRDPEDTRRLHGVRAVGPWGALLALLRVQVLIVAGGMFSSHMGPMQRLIPWFIRLARLFRVRCLFEGIGIYANTPPETLARLRAVMSSVESVTVRDSVCVEVVAGLGARAEIVPDMANHMPAASEAEADDLLLAEGVPAARPLVGLALTVTGSDDAARVVETFSALVNEMPEVTFVFTPMCQHPWVESHNDLVLADRIAARAPALRIIRGWYRPQQVMAVFGRLDAAVCMRYHSLLFAWRQNCPIVALPYSPKCDDFIQAHELPQSDIDAGAIRAHLENLIGSMP